MTGQLSVTVTWEGGREGVSVDQADDDILIAEMLYQLGEAGGLCWADAGEGLFVVYGTNRTVRYRLTGPGSEPGTFTARRLVMA